MKKTEYLGLTLLERSDNMDWEQGVNENLRKLDKAAAEAAIYVKPQRLVFGPAGSNPSACDYVCPSYNVGTYITNIVEEKQRTGTKTLKKSLGSVTFSVVNDTTSGCPASTGEVAPENISYIGYMAIDEVSGALLGYVISWGDDQCLLDRRITGTYSVGLYEAAQITLEFLPGTYNMGTPNELSWDRWFPTNDIQYVRKGTSASAAYSAGSSERCGAFGITGRSALLRLFGSVNILGNGALLNCNHSTQSGSLNQSECDPVVVSCVGGRIGFIRDIRFQQLTNGSYWGTAARMTHISISCKALYTVDNLYFNNGIPDVGFEVLNCRHCRFSNFKSPDSDINSAIYYNINCVFTDFDFCYDYGSADKFSVGYCTNCSFLNIVGHAGAGSGEFNFTYSQNLFIANITGAVYIQSECGHISVYNVFGYLDLKDCSCVKYANISGSVTVAATATNTNSGTNPRAGYRTACRTPARLLSIDEATGAGTFALYPVADDLNFYYDYANGSAQTYAITDYKGSVIVPATKILIPDSNRTLKLTSGLSGYSLSVGKLYYIGQTTV